MAATRPVDRADTERTYDLILNTCDQREVSLRWIGQAGAPLFRGLIWKLQRARYRAQTLEDALHTAKIVRFSMPYHNVHGAAPAHQSPERMAPPWINARSVAEPVCSLSVNDVAPNANLDDRAHQPLPPYVRK